MIVDNLFDNKKNTNESLADEFMAMARAKGMNPRLAGTPDQERARTDAMLKQRAADRANAPKPQPIDAETRAHLQDQLKSLEATFDPNYEYSDDHGFWKEQSIIAQQINRIKAELSKGVAEDDAGDVEQRFAAKMEKEKQRLAQLKKTDPAAYKREMEKRKTSSRIPPVSTFEAQGVAEGKHNKKRKLDEAWLMEDPVYRKFKTVGRYIAERRMSEKEILQVFADAEAGMTDKATGANRTMLGRGKDTTMDFAGGVKDAVSSVLNSIQNSVPVAAVDVAYDQATDALANVAGGQKGKVMQAIKGYRNLVKQYPKTAGFAKAALVAIAGLATGGASLPVIAGLTYALDSAIRGDKLSSVIGKGAGATALGAAGQAAYGAMTPDVGQGLPSQPSAASDFGAGTYDAGATGAGTAAGQQGQLLSWSQGVGPGDTLSSLAKQYNVSVDELLKANPQITNPDMLQVGSSIQIPTYNFQGDQWGSGLSTYDKGVGTSADTMAKIKTGQYTDSPISQALAKKVRESVKFKTLPVDKLIDRQSTVMTWALNESVGKPQGQSVQLTTAGTYTVFENVDRYRKAVMELAGVPGSTRPAQYRPDMPGGAGVKSKPGIVGRGLNWLDKTAGKVGGALSNFGHQFTTGVTKEKLKMNWQQAGKPSDSDQLSAWLVKQGVPQEVVTTVYGKMGLPVSAAPAASTEPQTTPEPQATTSGAQRLMPFNNINPKTGQRWTVDDLEAERRAQTTAEPEATTTATAQNPTGFNAANVMKLPGMEKYAKTAPAAPTKTPNFAGPGGYSNVTTSFKPTTPTKASAVTTAPSNKYSVNLPAGGGAGVKAAAEPEKLSKDEYIKRINAPAMPESRVFNSLKKPVAEMLAMVETKEDVAKIKQFIDQTFVKYGAVTESAFAERNKLIEHVTQVGAQRRREFARKS
jgi:LysM repeat protein